MIAERSHDSYTDDQYGLIDFVRLCYTTSNVPAAASKTVPVACSARAGLLASHALGLFRVRTRRMLCSRLLPILACAASCDCRRVGRGETGACSAIAFKTRFFRLRQPPAASRQPLVRALIRDRMLLVLSQTSPRAVSTSTLAVGGGRLRRGTHSIRMVGADTFQPPRVAPVCRWMRFDVRQRSSNSGDES
jgi:hypothetical protein